MDKFLRGISLFFLGALVGAVGILFFTPSFNVVVSRHPGALKMVELSPPAGSDSAKTPEILTNTKPVALPVAPSTPGPTPTAVVVAPAPVAPTAPIAAEPTIDFKSISEHLILWPTVVTVKAATTVPVMGDGKKVQDLALDVGTVLQVSKVLADGSLEARAKGAKFEIKSSLTDFSVELGKRVSELVAKGVKIDSPFTAPPVVTPVAASAAPVAMAPAVTTPTAPVAVVAPKGPLTLAQRVDVLFGNMPDAVIPSAPVAPVTSAPAAAAPAAPTAPAAAVPAAPVVEAVPAAEPKAVEKGKDLDRKMNQLFK